MKKILLSVLSVSFIISSFTVNADDTFCVARKWGEVNYSSAIKYDYACTDGTVDHSKVLTTAFLIIPFPGREKTNRQNIDKEMQAKGLIQLEALKGVMGTEPGWDDNILKSTCSIGTLLYGPESYVGKSYCITSRYNKQEIGMGKKVIIYDYEVTCNNSEDVRFEGVTELELENYMLSEGYSSKGELQIDSQNFLRYSINCQGYVGYADQQTIYVK
ncbi:MAG: hypothetical protein H6621_11070 [Halobacteriovoraceae bacterium]|nr:hypothetical protein [Halobacteriovoraceae bacterium]MCB9095599.1 hypothetical protein [Halobacteriovoraceae bacterium]